MISALTIAEKDEALSFASGSAVFAPLSDVKDTYGLGRSRWDRPGVPRFSQAPRKCQFLQTPGCTLSSKVLKLLRVEISWAGFSGIQLYL